MIYLIDGLHFTNLEEFWLEIERSFDFTISTIGKFRKTFSGLRELLKALPKDTIVVWRNSKISLQRLGYTETLELLKRTQSNCHPSWIDITNKEIELAQLDLGETIFDTIVKIFVEESISLRLE